jgi:hypothetical protein
MIRAEITYRWDWKAIFSRDTECILNCRAIVFDREVLFQFVCIEGDSLGSQLALDLLQRSHLLLEDVLLANRAHFLLAKTKLTVRVCFNFRAF